MKLRNRKTGEIIEDVKYIDTSLTTIEIHYLDNGISRMITEKNYHSFLQNWEDYDAPKEPLIKDEKIRKVVRVWAEVNKTKYVWVTVTFDGISITQDERHPFPTEYKQSITFECEVEFKSGYYTITELCGEEEAPEPIEPTFVDLDERIKGKEEE